ncbi:MAG: hypothetical protein ACFE8J_19505 [Candidatus Heimdallarchaeota archaeon]
MEIIDNLKKLGLKENRKLLILVVWLHLNILLIEFPYGITVQLFNMEMDLLDLIGMIIYLPFLTFITFLFILSLLAKKDVKEIASWKVLLYFFLSLPLMFLLIFILVGMFLFSIISYFFLTSWFILYGGYLSSKRLDDTLKRKLKSGSYRTLTFIVGFTLSIGLLGGYLIGSQFIGDLTGIEINQAALEIINYVVAFIGAVIIFFLVIAIVSIIKKVFNAWLGMFSLLVVLYTFYLLIKLFLALRNIGGGESSIATQFILLFADLGILLYSISTLMGSQAELLSKRIKSKRIGLDTVLMWLLFSKVSYEFAKNFPYTLLGYLPYINILSFLNESIINLLRNILILFFFILILIVLGLYETRKFYRNEKKFKDKVDKEVKDLLSFEDTIRMKDIQLQSEEINNIETFEDNIVEEREEIEKSYLEEDEGKNEYFESKYNNDSNKI